MKYTAEEVRDYADACRLAHKGPVIADMLTELAERIKVDESAAPVGFVMEATATRHKFGLLTQDLPPGAELFTHPPAQAAQVESDADMAKQVLAWMTRTGSLSTTWGDMAALSQSAAEPVVHGEVCKICGKDTPHHHLRGTAPTPAPPINLAAVREVIAHLRSFRSNTPPTWAHLDDAADKLAAALQEGAG